MIGPRPIVLLAVVVLTGCSASVTGAGVAPTSSEDAVATSSPLTANTTENLVTTSSSPTSPAAAHRVAVIGDFGDGSRAQADLASQMKALDESDPLDALVTVGDNFYTDDIDANWEVPYGWVTDRGIPVFAALGNHDARSRDRVDAEVRLWGMPGPWYSTRLGRYTLVVLDANDPTSSDQLAWLDETLAGPGPFVVAFHQPAYSCALHKSTSEIVRTWVPRFEAANVALVLNGHDHDYQRFQSGGVVYVVTGGGGAELYRVGRCPRGTPPPVAADDSHHEFVILDMTDAILGTVVASDGTVLDSFVIGPEH